MGPPNFSAPVARSSACSRCTRWACESTISFVFATTYSVLLTGSITGVPVMPISGTMSWPGSVVLLTSLLGTVVTPAAGLRKFTCQSCPAAPLSASKAYTLSCLCGDEDDVADAEPGDVQV